MTWHTVLLILETLLPVMKTLRHPQASTSLFRSLWYSISPQTLRSSRASTTSRLYAPSPNSLSLSSRILTVCSDFPLTPCSMFLQPPTIPTRCNQLKWQSSLPHQPLFLLPSWQKQPFHGPQADNPYQPKTAPSHPPCLRHNTLPRSLQQTHSMCPCVPRAEKWSVSAKQ